MTAGVRPVQGVGLGLRRAFLGPLADRTDDPVDFYELAPENWIDVGGRSGRRFRRVAERAPLVCHGLSLDLGGPAPLDEALLRDVRAFLDDHRVAFYSEHLSWCGDGGHLYDLLPLPFTEAAVEHVSGRIGRAQDVLGRRMAVENVSYYAAPGAEMTELEFLCAVLERADCLLMLDVNNVFVNAVNHGYDPLAFLDGLPGERIAYGHVAGHDDTRGEIVVDTHGSAVCDPVWDLLDAAYARFGVFPTVLERDFSIPPLDELVAEARTIGAVQARHRSAARTIGAAAGDDRRAEAG